MEAAATSPCAWFRPRWPTPVLPALTERLNAPCHGPSLLQARPRAGLASVLPCLLLGSRIGGLTCQQAVIFSVEPFSALEGPFSNLSGSAGAWPGRDRSRGRCSA